MGKIIFIALIIWRVVSAVRKSQREAAAKRAPGVAPAPSVLPVNSQVAASEPSGSTAGLYTDTTDRWDTASDIDSFLSSQPVITEAQPQEIDYQPLFAEKERRTMKSRTIGPGVKATPIDDYALTTAPVRRTISLDKESLRTVVLTREILGPPRSRSRYRPGTRK